MELEDMERLVSRHGAPSGGFVRNVTHAINAVLESNRACRNTGFPTTGRRA